MRREAARPARVACAAIKKERVYHAPAAMRRSRAPSAPRSLASYAGQVIRRLRSTVWMSRPGLVCGSSWWRRAGCAAGERGAASGRLPQARPATRAAPCGSCRGGRRRDLPRCGRHREEISALSPLPRALMRKDRSLLSLRPPCGRNFRCSGGKIQYFSAKSKISFTAAAVREKFSLQRWKNSIFLGKIESFLHCGRDFSPTLAAAPSTAEISARSPRFPPRFALTAIFRCRRGAARSRGWSGGPPRRRPGARRAGRRALAATAW